MQIQVSSVSKSFNGGCGGVAMYGGLDITPESGDFICITGPSRCGKTTLLRIVASFEKMDAGTITIDGRPVVGPHKRTTMAFQEGVLFPWLNVRRNIEYGMRIAGAPAAERAARSDGMLKMMDLVGVWGFVHARDVRRDAPGGRHDPRPGDGSGRLADG